MKPTSVRIVGEYRNECMGWDGEETFEDFASRVKSRVDIMVEQYNLKEKAAEAVEIFRELQVDL